MRWPVASPCPGPARLPSRTSTWRPVRGQPGRKEVEGADRPEPLLQGSFHVAVGEGWIPGAPPAQRPGDEAALVEGALEPGVVEALQVGVRDVAEGHAQSPVEPLLEQGTVEAGGDETDVVVGEPRLGRCRVVLGGREAVGGEAGLGRREEQPAHGVSWGEGRGRGGGRVGPWADGQPFGSPYAGPHRGLMARGAAVRVHGNREDGGARVCILGADGADAVGAVAVASGVAPAPVQGRRSTRKTGRASRYWTPMSAPGGCRPRSRSQPARTPSWA